MERQLEITSQAASIASVEIDGAVHIPFCLAMIAEASALAGSGSAVILGCGRCKEIPLRLLAQKFDVVDLVDIDEDALVAVDQQCKQWYDARNSCRFYCADLTGMIARVGRRVSELVAKAVDPIACLEQLAVSLESMAPEFWAPPRGERYDLLVCSMVLTQLQALVRESVEKIYLGRFPEYAAAMLKHKSWCEFVWNFARNLEDGFIEHLGTLIKPQGIVYLSETVHVSWLTQLDEQSVYTEGRWITLRTSRLTDYLRPGDTIIKEQHWDWLRKDKEGDFWGRLYGVQAVIYRVS
jgi:hypothetical protein